MPRLKKKYQQSAREQAVRESPASASISIAPAFLSVEQAATYFAVTTWTIRRLISTGKLTAKQIGKRFIIRRADLDALWVNEKAVEIAA